jgi:hypothetical protein
MYSIDRKLYAPPEQTPHPNWSKWKLRRLVELWEATSLSLNLEPTEMQVFRHRSGKFDDDSFLLFSPSFMERLLVAYSSIATSFGFSKDHELKAQCIVELPKFAGWAVEANLPDLPPEMAAMATGRQPAPAQDTEATATVVTASDGEETKEERQDRRLKDCEDAGLKMPSSYPCRLPNGVGKVADTEGVTRQAFSTDVKVALERRVRANKVAATVHRA